MLEEAIKAVLMAFLECRCNFRLAIKYFKVSCPTSLLPLFAMEQSVAQWVFCSSPLLWLRETKKIFVGNFAQIKELHDESANMTVMLKSKRNMGIDSFRLFDEIQDQE